MLEPFKQIEHCLDADTLFPNLLPKGVVTATDSTPTIATEVSGIYLGSLSAAGKDELARFVAQRKVVAFRGQDFAELFVQEALDFGGYFGRHVSTLPWRYSFGMLTARQTPHPPDPQRAPGYTEIYLVHSSAGDNSVDKFFANRTSSVT